MPTFSDITESPDETYKAETIDREQYKVFFHTCERMPEIPDNSIHGWFTSPPYATMRGTMAYPSYVEYLQTMYSILKEMYRTLKPGRCMGINISDYQISEQLDTEVIKGTDFELGEKFDCPSHFSYLMYKLGNDSSVRRDPIYEDTIVWKKSGSTSNRAGTFISSGNPLKYRPNEVTERVIVFRKGKIDYRRVWKDARRENLYPDADISTYEKFEDHVAIDYKDERDFLTNVWEIVPETQSDHPAPFPVELAEQWLKLYTLPNETVADPFLGSATTIRAAQKLGRKGIGYENFDAESEESGSFRDMIINRVGADTGSISSFM